MIRNVITKICERSIDQSMKMSLAMIPQTSTARRSADETLDHIRVARMNWEQGIIEELRAIVFEAKRTFFLIREQGASNPWLLHNQTQEEAAETIKFLYDSEDLMETILAIRNPNIKPNQTERYLGLIKLNTAVPEYNELLKRFPDLQLTHSQLGLDETQLTAAGLKMLASRHEEGEAIITSGSMLDARKFMHRGVPPTLRGKIWRLACGLPEKTTMTEEQTFRRLRYECDRLDIITDELFMHDIQTVLDDPRFFVFEEELKETIFSFARDSYILENAAYEIHSPFSHQIGDEYKADVPAPPCGVQPFLGLALYFAPLCYVLSNKASLYHVTRYLYCRLWCKLNVISEDEGTLVPLCRIFECLLIRAHPKLFIHLVNIGLNPVKIAFPWIQLAFVGFLEIDQVMHLWDRLIGYMDLTLLAIAAVAIFMHRSDTLLRVRSSTKSTANYVIFSYICVDFMA